MKTRICPLCDQPMKKAHRCDSCNSFIWKPLYLDIHYNTGNTYEMDCSYDLMNHTYEYDDSGSVTMMPSDNEKDKHKQKFRGREEIEYSIHKASEKMRENNPDLPEKNGGFVKKLVFIFFILSMLSTVFEILFTLIADMGTVVIMP